MYLRQITQQQKYLIKIKVKGKKENTLEMWVYMAK